MYTVNKKQKTLMVPSISNELKKDEKNKFYVRWHVVSLGQPEVKFLGYQINRNSIKTLATKITSPSEFKLPLIMFNETNIKSIERSF